jgi:hypothetical protein
MPRARVEGCVLVFPQHVRCGSPSPGTIVNSTVVPAWFHERSSHLDHWTPTNGFSRVKRATEAPFCTSMNRSA